MGDLNMYRQRDGKLVPRSTAQHASTALHGAARRSTAHRSAAQAAQAHTYLIGVAQVVQGLVCGGSRRAGKGAAERLSDPCGRASCCRCTRCSCCLPPSIDARSLGVTCCSCCGCAPARISTPVGTHPPVTTNARCLPLSSARATSMHPPCRRRGGGGGGGGGGGASKNAHMMRRRKCTGRAARLRKPFSRSPCRRHTARSGGGGGGGGSAPPQSAWACLEVDLRGNPEPQHVLAALDAALQRARGGRGWGVGGWGGGTCAWARLPRRLAGDLPVWAAAPAPTASTGPRQRSLRSTRHHACPVAAAPPPCPPPHLDVQQVFGADVGGHRGGAPGTAAQGEARVQVEVVWPLGCGRGGVGG